MNNIIVAFILGYIILNLSKSEVRMSTGEFRSSAIPSSKGVFQNSEIHEFIRSVRSHQGQEDRYVSSILPQIRKDISSPEVPIKAVAIAKLFYLSLFGYDMTWAATRVLDLLSHADFSWRRFALLCCSCLLGKSVDVTVLATSALKRALAPMEAGICSVALSCLGSMGTESVFVELLNDVVQLSKSTNALLRKKAVVTMFKAGTERPDTIPLLVPVLKDLLADPSETVVARAVDVGLHLFRAFVKQPETASERLALFLQLIPRLNKMLEDNNVENWILIKILPYIQTAICVEPRLAARVQQAVCKHLASPARSVEVVTLECVMSTFPFLSCEREWNAALQQTRRLILHSEPNLQFIGLKLLATACERIQQRNVKDDLKTASTFRALMTETDAASLKDQIMSVFPDLTEIVLQHAASGNQIEIITTYSHAGLALRCVSMLLTESNFFSVAAVLMTSVSAQSTMDSAMSNSVENNCSTAVTLRLLELAEKDSFRLVRSQLSTYLQLLSSLVVSSDSNDINKTQTKSHSVTAKVAAQVKQIFHEFKEAQPQVLAVSLGILKNVIQYRAKRTNLVNSVLLETVVWLVGESAEHIPTVLLKSQVLKLLHSVQNATQTIENQTNFCSTSMQLFIVTAALKVALRAVGKQNTTADDNIMLLNCYRELFGVNKESEQKHDELKQNNGDVDVVFNMLEVSSIIVTTTVESLRNNYGSALHESPYEKIFCAPSLTKNDIEAALSLETSFTHKPSQKESTNRMSFGSGQKLFSLRKNTQVNVDTETHDISAHLEVLLSTQNIHFFQPDQGQKNITDPNITTTTTKTSSHLTLTEIQSLNDILL